MGGVVEVEKVERLDLDVFERLEKHYPTIAKSYSLKSLKIFDGEKEDEMPSFVSFKLERIRESLGVYISDDVSEVEIELSEAKVIPVCGAPMLSLRFKLTDGGFMEINFWYDSAKKLIQFFKEAIEKLEREIEKLEH